MLSAPVVAQVASVLAQIAPVGTPILEVALQILPVAPQVRAVAREITAVACDVGLIFSDVGHILGGIGAVARAQVALEVAFVPAQISEIPFQVGLVLADVVSIRAHVLAVFADVLLIRAHISAIGLDVQPILSQVGPIHVLRESAGPAPQQSRKCDSEKDFSAHHDLLVSGVTRRLARGFPARHHGRVTRPPGTSAHGISSNPKRSASESAMPRPQVALAPPAHTPAPHETAALIARAREGELAAFERLIAEHQGRVLTFAFAFTGDPEQAKDLAQEALVKVYRALPQFRFQAAFSTWLYAIVKNTYVDHCRSRAERERRVEEPLEAAALEALTESVTAEDQMLEREARRLLLRALREVPLPHRVVVALADVQGLDYAEIAQVLSVPVGTVKSRLARGREALRQVLFRKRREEAKP